MQLNSATRSLSPALLSYYFLNLYYSHRLRASLSASSVHTAILLHGSALFFVPVDVVDGVDDRVAVSALQSLLVVLVNCIDHCAVSQTMLGTDVITDLVITMMERPAAMDRSAGRNATRCALDVLLSRYSVALSYVVG